MKKILFPTEFSDQGPQTLRYALELAKRFEAKIVAMHVYPTAELILGNKEEEIEVVNQMMDVLKDFVIKNSPPEYKDVEIEYILDMGLPGEEIVEVSLDENIGLIVMGMTGKNDAIDKLFGSISQQVIGKADCPVLAIPASYQFKKPKKILYTTDFHFRDLGALQTLGNWATKLDAKIQCLHVVKKGENEISALVNMGTLREAFKGETFTAFDTIVGDLHEVTVEYVNEGKADMVVMLSRKRNLFQQIIEGSQAKKVARKVEVPILIFKGNAYEQVPRAMDFRGFSIA